MAEDVEAKSRQVLVLKSSGGGGARRVRRSGGQQHRSARPPARCLDIDYWTLYNEISTYYKEYGFFDLATFNTFTRRVLFPAVRYRIPPPPNHAAAAARQQQAARARRPPHFALQQQQARGAAGYIATTAGQILQSLDALSLNAGDDADVVSFDNRHDM